MPTTASVAHHLRPSHRHPSRTRIRVPREVVEQVASRVRLLPQVSDVQARPSTGSILVQHQNSLDDLIAKLEAEGICDVIGLPDEASDALAACLPLG